MWHIPEGSLNRCLCTTPSAGPGVLPGCGGVGGARAAARAGLLLSVRAECLSASEGWVLLVHR